MDDDPELHSVLRRQLRRIGLTADEAPSDDQTWRRFLWRVNAAYSDSDQQQYLHDRAFEVSSKEMHLLTEELRRASATQLALERDRLQAVFDSVSTGLVVLDGDARLVELNRAAGVLLGVDGDDHIGQSLWTVLVMDETSALELENACSGNRGWSRPDLRLGLRDGSTVPVSSQFTPLSQSTHDEKGGVLTLTDLTESKQAELHTEWLASHDQLTGLLNRASISSRLNAALQRAEQYQLPAAVLFIDLDHFKLVNDTLGHAAGDELLVMAADRLQRVVRRVDALGRFGGDEFIVVMERVHDAESVESLADRIAAAMRSPFALTSAETELTYLSTSIGTSVSKPGDTASELLSSADLALYEAKRNGRDRAVAYDAVLRENVDRRVRMERLLRAAFDAGELEVHYQPIFAVPDSSVIGFEALVRWHLEGRGWVPPSEFLPLAEESGLINRIGQFTLAEGVSFARELAASFAGKGPFVSVNVLALQIDRDNLPEQIDLLLGQREDGQAPVPDGAIRLELTEAAMLADPVEASAMLERLAELGVSVMLDGFGAGHGSLAGLRRFRVDGIKVDRALSQHVRSSAEDRAIIKAVIDLGHALGAQVIAEGVDDAEQRNTLMELGCDALQGPMLSPPLLRQEALQSARALLPPQVRSTAG